MIPETMKAAVVEKFSAPLSIREDPGPGEVLLELVASGVWHTDFSADDDGPKNQHSLSGQRIVVALGSGVTRLKEGDRVGLAWLYSTCRTLEDTNS
jgi:propanol-preferring alcohol dehydrogenase